MDFCPFLCPLMPKRATGGMDQGIMKNSGMSNAMGIKNKITEKCIALASMIKNKIIVQVVYMFHG